MNVVVVLMAPRGPEKDSAELRSVNEPPFKVMRNSTDRVLCNTLLPFGICVRRRKTFCTVAVETDVSAAMTGNREKMRLPLLLWGATTDFWRRREEAGFIGVE